MKTIRFLRPLFAVLSATVVGWIAPASFSALHAVEPVPGLIDVKVTGSGGRSVLFIPGLATPGSVWDDTVAQLAKVATCHVVTLAGFGAMPSVGKREHYLTDVRDALISYVREHRLDHPLIVGHSLGGVVALDLAATAPALPGRLIVVDSLPFLAGMMSPEIKTEADAQGMAVNFGLSIALASQAKFADGQKRFVGGMVTSPEKAAAIADLTGKSDPGTVGQAMTELLARDLRPILAAIKCPVLILGALADKVEPGTTRDEIEKRYRGQYVNLPQVKFQFFGQARHFIMVDDPAGFQAVLAAQLAEPAAR